MKKSKTFHGVAVIALCLLMTLTVVPSFLFVNAKDAVKEKVVRVGWYESPFNLIDQYGRRSGYAYDYQMKLSACTGWKYEYVTGSWPELYQMLLDGKIDMLSDFNGESINRGMPDSAMTSLFVVEDTEVPAQDTIYGKTAFLQLVGITYHDALALKEDWATNAPLLYERIKADNPDFVTDMSSTKSYL